VPKWTDVGPVASMWAEKEQGYLILSSNLRVGHDPPYSSAHARRMADMAGAVLVLVRGKAELKKFKLGNGTLLSAK
jgi:hypothetical protein